MILYQSLLFSTTVLNDEHRAPNYITVSASLLSSALRLSSSRLLAGGLVMLLVDIVHGTFQLVHTSGIMCCLLYHMTVCITFIDYYESHTLHVAM